MTNTIATVDRYGNTIVVGDRVAYKLCDSPYDREGPVEEILPSGSMYVRGPREYLDLMYPDAVKRLDNGSSIEGATPCITDDNPAAAETCMTCGASIDATLNDETAAHWWDGVSAEIVGWTCSQECSDAFDATRGNPPISTQR